MKSHLPLAILVIGGLILGWISVAQPYLKSRRTVAELGLISEVKQIQKTYRSHLLNGMNFLSERTDCLKTLFPNGLTSELDPKQECDSKSHLKSADGSILNDPNDNPFRFEIICQQKGVLVRPKLREGFPLTEDGQKIGAYRKVTGIDLTPLLEQGERKLCKNFPSPHDLKQIETVRKANFTLEIQPIVGTGKQADSTIITVAIKNTFNGPNRLTRGMCTTLFSISNQNLEIITPDKPSGRQFALGLNCVKSINMDFAKGEVKSFEVGLRKKYGNRRESYNFHLTIGALSLVKSNTLTIRI